MIGKNNVVNIRCSSAYWRGQSGEKRGFCEFQSVPWCLRAAMRLLLRKYPKAGARTVAQCITRWAPPEDNNNTEAYIRFVCVEGIKPDTKMREMSLTDLYNLLHQMAKIETRHELTREDFIKGYELYKAI